MARANLLYFPRKMDLSKFLKRDLSRGKIALLLIALTILLLILFGISSDSNFEKESKSENYQEAEQVADSPEVKGEQSMVESQDVEEDIQEDDEFEVEGVRVTKVIDGDTIEIEGGVRVRYIGIDTPETVHPLGIVGCYGRQASNKNRELVEGKIVKLEKDASQTDKYGRLLRYVYAGDIFVNDYLVRYGFANASSYPPDIKYQDQFREAEREARENNRGLWGVCEGNGQSSYDTMQPPSSDSGDCDSSYPTVCIVPPPPDLDCGDIVFRRFKVISPDPHHFDIDNDGIGCESI